MADAWGGYITNLTACEGMEAAAIYSHDGALWAKSDSMADIQPGEIRALAAGSMCGVTMGGKKCMVLRKEDEGDKYFTLQLRMKDDNNDSHCTTVGKTNLALVIGTGTKDASAGRISNKVYEIAEYLRKAQY